MESKYDKKLRSLREELELRRKTEIHEIEEVSLVNVSVLYKYIINLLILNYFCYIFFNLNSAKTVKSIR